MTDQHDPLDDLASAHLDGHTTPEEVARVATDPVLSARIARFETARAALRATAAEPVDPHERDSAIAAALTAFDEGHDHVVRPVAAFRARRWWVAPRALRLAGVAAAVALLALAVPLLGRLDRDGDEDVASIDERAGADRGETGDAATDLSETAGGVPGAATAAPGPDDLGSFEGLRALAAAVRDRLEASTTAGSSADAALVPEAATTTARVSACDEELARRFGPASRYSALATLDGEPVTVVVYEDGDGALELVVVDRAACTEVTRTPL